MPPDHSPARRSPFRFLLARPYSVLAALALAAFAVKAAAGPGADWTKVYLPAAQRLAAGEELYQDKFVEFTYPPVNAWMMLPFVGLPTVPARLLWYLLSAVALIVLVRGAWALSGGGRLEGEPPGPRREHIIAGLGLACAAGYVLDVLTNEQNDLLIGALVVLGCRLLARGRGTGAGVLFGLAAGIKCTPLLWAPYLLYRRQWAGAVLVPVVACGINLLPDLTHPPPGPDTRLGEWTRRFLLPMAGKEHQVGQWATEIEYNHSLNGLFSRWLMVDRDWKQTFFATQQLPPPRTDPGTVKLVALAATGLLVAFTVGCSWVGDRRYGRATLGSGPPPTRQALEFSLVVVLMLLLSPQSSKPHFCTLVLPGFCLARAALAWPSRAILGLAVAAAVLGLAANKDLVGPAVYDWLKWYGGITVGAVLLHVGCCLGLVRRPVW